MAAIVTLGAQNYAEQYPALPSLLLQGRSALPLDEERED